MKKKMILSVICLGMLSQPLLINNNSSFAIEVNNQKFDLIVNEKSISNSSMVYKDEDKLMLPLRAVAQELGYSVNFNEKTKSIEITNNINMTNIQIGKNSYYHDRIAPFTLKSEPVLKSGVTYVPVDFFERVLKSNVIINNEKIQIFDQNIEQKMNQGKFEDLKNKKDENINKNEEKKEYVSIEAKIKEVKNVDENFYITVEPEGKADIVLILTKDTKLMDSDGKKINAKDLKKSDLIFAKHSMIMTKSLPGQTIAFEIKLK